MGIAFISFQEPDVADEIAEENYIFTYNVEQNEEMRALGAEVGLVDWDFDAAELPLDMVWANLDLEKQQDVLSGNFGMLFKKLVVVIMQLSMCLLNVVALLYVQVYLSHEGVEGDLYWATVAAKFLISGGLVLFNLLVVPYMLCVGEETVKRLTKSSKDENFFWGYNFLLFLNTLLLPIISFYYFESAYRKDSTEVAQYNSFDLDPRFLAKCVFKNSEFFLLYIVNCTFFMLVFQLVTPASKIKHNCEEISFSPNGKKKLLHWLFDPIYSAAVQMNVYMLSMVFSVTNPLILFVGLVFFFASLLMDKYNFL